MREILFRGKRSDGEWAFGSLLKVTFDGTTYNLIFADNFLFVFGQAKAMEHAAVIPKTVGQFVGLTDKNGKKIFEGDILSEHGSLFLVVWDKKWARFKLQHIDRAIQYPEWNRGEQMEIVGNIHDNPELLGGGGSE